MSSLLYRLGRFAIAKRFVVIGVWVAIVAIAGIAMALFQVPRPMAFDLPRSDMSRTLEITKAELPDAAGAVVAVALQSKDGAFTAEQKATISKVLTEWKDVKTVRYVVDPFPIQQQIDDGRTKLADGKKQLNEGWAKLHEGKSQLSAGWGLYNAEDQALNKEMAADPAGVASGKYAKRVAAQTELRTMLEGGQAQVKDGEAKLQAGQNQYNDGYKQFETAAGLRMVSPDGKVALAQILFDKDNPTVPPSAREAIPAIGEQLAKVGVGVDYAFELSQDTRMGGVGEIIGVAVAALALLLFLRSFTLALLPLVVAGVGVGTAEMTGLALTPVIELHQMAPLLGVMLGLAVGIDYALVMAHRHQAQMLDGMELNESIAQTVSKSGTEVVAAGSTVVIALVALLVSRLPILAQMGLLAAAVVATSVLVTVTLLPALFAVLGRRVVTARARAKADKKRQAAHGGLGDRWVQAITRRPVLTLCIGAFALAMLSIPAISLRPGIPDGSGEPNGSSANNTYRTISQHFGEGMNGLMLGIAKYPQPIADAQMESVKNDLAAKIKETGPFAAVVALPFTSADKTVIGFQIVPTEGPGKDSTTGAVFNLRQLSDRLSSTGVDLGLIGQTTANLELTAALNGALPVYLALVVGLSLVIVGFLFRSLWVPVIATAGFLLSIGAAFGTTVAVYQWGWFKEVFGVDNPGPVLCFMPIMLIGVLFGLAMDYQVFIVSGMKEAYAKGTDPRQAVRFGFREGYPVVATAAFVMVAVFGGFTGAHLVTLHSLAFALAAGVLIDAFVVRLTLTPVLMHLLAGKAWQLPSFAGKVAVKAPEAGRHLPPRTA